MTSPDERQAASEAANAITATPRAKMRFKFMFLSWRNESILRPAPLTGEMFIWLSPVGLCG